MPLAKRLHYCGQCREWTEHEREATLPRRYQQDPDSAFYDPDYEDRSKCGECGEPYTCGECGGAWDVDEEQCGDVLDHGYHGPDTGPLTAIIADGIPWQDADGRTSWPQGEAVALAAAVESKGYAVELRTV